MPQCKLWPKRSFKHYQPNLKTLPQCKLWTKKSVEYYKFNLKKLLLGVKLKITMVVVKLIDSQIAKIPEVHFLDCEISAVARPIFVASVHYRGACSC